MRERNKNQALCPSVVIIIIIRGYSSAPDTVSQRLTREGLRQELESPSQAQSPLPQRRTPEVDG